MNKLLKNSDHQHSIIIVEDALMIAYHIKRSLEGIGYRIAATVESGENLIAYLSNNTLPDLILMDIVLSGEIDGIETAEIINQKYNIPFIYLTALNDRKTIQRAKLTKPYGYIMKPFNERELHISIAMAIQKAEVQVQLRESEERYYSTVMAIKDLILTFDQQFNIVFINQSFQHLYEENIEEGSKLDDILIFRSLEDGKKVNLIELFLNGKPFPNQLMMKNLANGKKNFIGEIAFSERKNLERNTKGYVLIFEEIGERIKKESLAKQFELQDLASKIKGQELERSRVSRALHDGLGQKLLAIKMNLQSNGGNKVSLNYNNIMDLITEAISEIKHIANDLMPIKLNELGLEDCLRALCCSFENCGINIHFSGHITDNNISDDLKLNLYRIAQEGLNNAIKYSEAQSINLQLGERNDIVFLNIEDDGKGFKVNKKMESTLGFDGHGLKNIEDRVKILGGNLEIDSRPSFGTLISIQVPNSQN